MARVRTRAIYLRFCGSLAVALFVIVHGTTACRSAKSEDPAAVPSAAVAVPVESGRAARAVRSPLEPPGTILVKRVQVPAGKLAIQNNVQALALPKGCRLTEFATVPWSSELQVEGTTGASTELLFSRAAVDRLEYGIWKTELGLVLPVPATATGGLPRLSYGAADPLVLVQRAVGQSSEIGLWRLDENVRRVGRGQSLAGVDLQCGGGRCVLLATRPGVPGRGAAVFMRDLAARQWGQTSIEAEGEPFAVVQAGGGRPWVAMIAESRLEIWAIGDKAERSTTLSTPHGTFAVGSPGVGPSGVRRAVAIVPERDRKAPCDPQGFPVSVLVTTPDQEEKVYALTLSAAPKGLVIRELTQGSVVSWIAPESCEAGAPKFAYALTLDASGKPRGRPAILQRASRLALAVSGRGGRASWWLQRENKLTRVRAGCSTPTSH